MLSLGLSSAADARRYDDHNLKSTLGRHDGRVYEAIYEEARKSPLNGRRMVGWDRFSQVSPRDERYLAEARSCRSRNFN
eukprot:SAG11_NODE_14028_length_628_cov_0.930057_1_plen_78_part_10